MNEKCQRVQAQSQHVVFFHAEHIRISGLCLSANPRGDVIEKSKRNPSKYVYVKTLMISVVFTLLRHS